MPWNTRRGRAWLTTASLLVAAALWLPTLQLWFRSPPDEAKASRGQALLRWQRAWWDGDQGHRAAAREAMRRVNPEWDLMGRTFVVLALANQALREPTETQVCLHTMDSIINATLARDEAHGMEAFLLPYAQRRPFVAQPARSLFVDGEIALMLAARQFVEPRKDYSARLRAQSMLVLERMQAGPVLSAESYPDECWTFCNTMALAALRVADAVQGENHAPFIERWVTTAREKLVDPATGLLVSEYTYDGRHLDGPEGSSIFFVAHALQLLDPVFAEQQYARARQLLKVQVLGFGYSREWPALRPGPADVDSGPIVPLLGASAGASGLAVLGAAAFDDEQWLAGLLASLDLAAFPVERDGTLRYAASNQVGDAVMTYALAQGPLWQAVTRRLAP